MTSFRQSRYGHWFDTGNNRQNPRLKALYRIYDVRALKSILLSVELVHFNFNGILDAGTQDIQSSTIWTHTWEIRELVTWQLGDSMKIQRFISNRHTF